MKTINDIRTVAVIGGGVTGIVAAYLLDRKYQVTLFEKNDYLGGHTNTRLVTTGSGSQVPVDTGFIVFNDRTYPHFTTFLKQLKVAAADAPMSFGYYNRAKDVQFCSRVPGGVFADRKNLVRPWYWRMIGEILRFNRQARRDLEAGRLGDMTLGISLGQPVFGGLSGLLPAAHGRGHLVFAGRPDRPFPLRVLFPLLR